MTKTEEKSLKETFAKLLLGIKNNPNHYPIIDKYNNRILQKNKFQIYAIIEDAVNKEIYNCLKELYLEDY